jgi:membrane protein DedA with SNARE-associated domain
MGVAWAMAPWIGSYDGLSYGGLMLVAMVSGLSFVIPGPSVAGVLVGGATLNPWLVGLCMGVGSAIGEMPGFAAVHLNADARVVRKVFGARFLTRWMVRHGPLTIFLLAAIPNFLFDVGAMVAGANRMKFNTFFFSTLFGKIVRFTMAALLSSQLARFF